MRDHLCRSLRSYSTHARRAIQAQNEAVNALVYTAEPTNRPNGPLKDLAIAVKANICTTGMPTTCSSTMLKDFTSPYNATVVNLLQEAGADIVGKTNCDEFGMGSLNVHSVHGPVVNPFNLPERRSAGGSSGGSAAAVAAGMCDAALATDTGGSTRLPASYCGVVGLKPSYGLISRWGLISYADSLDCVGVIAKDVDTTKRVFDVISAYDSKDPTAATPTFRSSAHSNLTERSIFLDGSLDGLRIGVPQEYFPAELDPSITEPFRAVLSSLQEMGATLVPVSLPMTRYALSAYYVLASAEASSNLGRFDGVQYGTRVDTPVGADKTSTRDVYAHTRSSGFGGEVKKRILLGTYALTADAFDGYFLQAQRVRTSIRQDFDRIFSAPNPLSIPPTQTPTDNGVDVLLHPSAIRTAPALPTSGTSDSRQTDLSAYVQDMLTVPASLAGLPALSVPACKGQDGWPVGVSVVGQWGSDELVLRVGKVLEGLRA
ncbi:amidase signature enzyme [Athelia psychrophila]|uniref:Glutamyl-tRNA(Gln) amidotransferase subunit A, mitochondrial n=1 Tax=Athelia psychrophila TaxID=1759441 RepID=A0A166RWP4_9AGAM|nr:amidase signature enzyme [Fibularhizoctonia sp. CBS 109695]